ncbi:MAG TPA: 4Fe-4S double cluster binding domain-containing protein [Spirochaetia bacterium]|nr:4Fe-4S double cluster binding domain-containing protein [Spirochaetia bacterium]HRZ65104.1 4Fe-4S double cluster binding domain-containing protein [Spirochaetia bacterium]
MAARIEVSGSELRYELIGAEHLGAIDEAWSARAASPGLSRHPVFRGYIEGFRAARPAGLEWAGALVIAALFSPGRVVEFSLPGGELRLLQPPNYIPWPASREAIRAALARELGCRVELASALPLKTLAAWSGLGRYGRNTIIYVEGMGSSANLAAFWAGLAGRSLPPPPGPAFLKRCSSCEACARACPTGAIPPVLGGIDAARCLPLYNEIEGEFPAWLDPASHNALKGCARCQEACPEDAPFRERRLRHGPFGEAELASLLRGAADPASDAVLARLLSEEDEESLAAERPVMRRNLAAFIEAERLRGLGAARSGSDGGAD